MNEQKVSTMTSAVESKVLNNDNVKSTTKIKQRVRSSQRNLAISAQ
jgi:hypothetical protein